MLCTRLVLMTLHILFADFMPLYLIWSSWQQLHWPVAIQLQDQPRLQEMLGAYVAFCVMQHHYVLRLHGSWSTCSLRQLQQIKLKQQQSLLWLGCFLPVMYYANCIWRGHLNDSRDSHNYSGSHALSVRCCSSSFTAEQLLFRQTCPFCTVLCKVT